MARALALLVAVAVAPVLPGEALAACPVAASVSAAELPAQARETLRRIERGGPFPFRRDGVIFSNRESLLPRHGHGYYREYTVPTPGDSDRGARRIVAGAGGERYYSTDHYRSFRCIEGTP
ncbi:MAG TPA: ribonuclease domain-containing protein [Anaeromyxobacteraceae bacterium]|nr:ribonuclease domain-containing protein [Anaeromyxobacteraceae bacterium]